MSETDTGTHTDAKVVRVVALVIGLSEAQKYLTEHNEVLEAMYGHAPLRYDVDSKEVSWAMLTPDIENDEFKLELLSRFPDVSMNELPGFLTSDEFYEEVLKEIESKITFSMVFAHEVQVVLAGDFVWEEGYPLREVCRRYFPNATLFKSAEHLGRGTPVKLD